MMTSDTSRGSDGVKQADGADEELPETKTEMEDLLEKARIVSRALQNPRNSKQPDYLRLARLLTDLSSANTYMVRQDGLIMGYAWYLGHECSVMEEVLRKGEMPEGHVEKLNMIRESVMNHSDYGRCSYFDMPCRYADKHVIYTPVFGMGERLGTLNLSRFGEPFETKDLVLAEYFATVVGLEMLNERNRDIEERGRERVVVQMAMRALSFSEIESIRHIIEELGGVDGVVVASRVADRVGVTRSVIVNALRKLGSAGIIESRSLGMKGTYIKVISGLFLDELGITPKRG